MSSLALSLRRLLTLLRNLCSWINDENPFEKSKEIAASNFQTPIDEVDAMARILDPVRLRLLAASLCCLN